MKEHHIGIVVKDIDRDMDIFGQLGYKACSQVTIDGVQNNRIIFLENSTSSQRIELIEPLNGGSTVRNFKPGIHHICYEVEQEGDFREAFREMGIGKIFTQDMAAPALDGRRVVFAWEISER